VKEVTKFFAETTEAMKQQQSKLDDRLQPIPDEIHGSIVRTKKSTLEEYEALGNETYSSFNSKSLPAEKLIACGHCLI